MKYGIGDIVFVNDVLDEAGKNPKCRPVVILGADGGRYFGICITRKYQDWVGTLGIEMRGNVPNRTYLDWPCAAKITWSILFKEIQIEKKSGVAEPKSLKQLVKMVETRIKEQADAAHAIARSQARATTTPPLQARAEVSQVNETSSTEAMQLQAKALEPPSDETRGPAFSHERPSD